MTFLPVICALLGLAVVLVGVPQVLTRFACFKAVNRGSDFHHTHAQPVPRIGGLVLAVAFILIEIFISFVAPEHRARTPARLAAILSSLAMFGLGFWDDIRPLGARKKLLGQILIATTVMLSGVGIQQFQVPFTNTNIDLGIWGVLLTVLWLVAMTNLINLIDGIDGLAGGICFMLMLLLAFVGHQSGNFQLLASGMAGALFGFLWYNFPPARIYLGDGGAYFLGFQIGLFSIINSHKGTVFVALVAPLFVLALPIVDTSLAILRRGLRGLPVFRPDRRHIHHHLIGMGLSRRRVVISIYAVTLLFLAMGFLAYWSRGNLVPVLLGVSVVILLLLAGKLEFSREWFAIGRVLGNSLGMRQQVRYALSLTKWLELEGTRQTSVDALFSDLAFAARKLGFSSVNLTLEGETLEWKSESKPSAVQTARFDLASSGCGKLEFEGPADGSESLKNTRAFEIISELLAEGWVKAVRPRTRHSGGRRAIISAIRPILDRQWGSSLPVVDPVQEGKP